MNTGVPEALDESMYSYKFTAEGEQCNSESLDEAYFKSLTSFFFLIYLF